jgi:hypothetical protein
MLDDLVNVAASACNAPFIRAWILAAAHLAVRVRRFADHIDALPVGQSTRERGVRKYRIKLAIDCVVLVAIRG